MRTLVLFEFISILAVYNQKIAVKKKNNNIFSNCVRYLIPSLSKTNQKCPAKQHFSHDYGYICESITVRKQCFRDLSSDNAVDGVSSSTSSKPVITNNIFTTAVRNPEIILNTYYTFILLLLVHY